ncbi:flavin-containing monooxygenase [Coprinopsis cinerea AmutBmut pab1-1]|nr:flavin-containing monooxygenase [Coprinopsis cinerea AmutBmut pab1-1]
MAIDPSPHPAEASLPTLHKLGFSLPNDPNADPKLVASNHLSSISQAQATAIAEAWLNKFANYASASPPNISRILDELILESDFDSAFMRGEDTNSTPGLGSYWRDVLALTWDYRSFENSSRIRKFLNDRLENAKLSNIQLAGIDGTKADPSLKDAPPPQFQQLFPDVAWIQFLFTFDTKVGGCHGVVRLVPQIQKGGGGDVTVVWKSFTILTVLMSLHGHPERRGPNRAFYPHNETETPTTPWEEQRKSIVDGFSTPTKERKNPTVLIIGGGQSGLTVAARLKYLGVDDALVVEKNEHVGDMWRQRYEALCLHDPVWYDHLPYIPFPDTWPVYTPAQKLANWLRSYADAMDLNVWTSATVTSAVQDPKSKLWTVKVVAKNAGKEQEHTLTVKHVVFAAGFVGGAYMPDLPGKDKFKGTVLHSSQHKSALDHAGKKVLVVGACTSAHDLCLDYARHGITPTMYQRSSTYIISGTATRVLLSGLYSETAPPTDIADLLNMSLMCNWGLAGVNRRVAVSLSSEGGVDEELIKKLNEKGFRTNHGFRGTGLFGLVWDKGGGYYFDFGASQAIIDGRIKVRSGNGSVVAFTQNGVRFEDGSEEQADVVVFCTGLANARTGVISEICGKEVAETATEIWGFNAEGEIRGVWAEIGHEGLWNMMGNLGMCRIHSRHVALQIVARENGIFRPEDRYSLQ